MSTGLLGGSFDPPHNGHVALARAALEELGLERLVVMVAGRPPHKEPGTDPETRFRLASAAFEEMPRVELSREELDRPGPGYTVDTVQTLERRRGDVVVVVGGDMFASFPSWREPDGILEHGRLAVAARPGTPREHFDAVLQTLARPDRVTFFELAPVDASSSEVRRLVAAGEPYVDLVPTAVAALIEDLGLYRESAASGGRLSASDQGR
jgi:nicotinate-nucleotide adenylyltransferase